MDFQDLLRQHRLLAIVRGHDTAASLRAVLTLAEEGITMVEVSLTTPGALTIIEQAKTALGEDITLGAGTVLTTKTPTPPTTREPASRSPPPTAKAPTKPHGAACRYWPELSPPPKCSPHGRTVTS